MNNYWCNKILKEYPNAKIEVSNNPKYCENLYKELFLDEVELFEEVKRQYEKTGRLSLSDVNIKNKNRDNILSFLVLNRESQLKNLVENGLDINYRNQGILPLRKSTWYSPEALQLLQKYGLKIYKGDVPQYVWDYFTVENLKKEYYKTEKDLYGDAQEMLETNYPVFVRKVKTILTSKNLREKHSQFLEQYFSLGNYPMVKILLDDNSPRIDYVTDIPRSYVVNNWIKNGGLEQRLYLLSKTIDSLDVIVDYYHNIGS